jgi:LmbE family N-acetylglucosaminyl deacetylase
MEDLRLLAVFAHPDDEAFGVGGSLTKYAAEGVGVYLVSATRGEAGEIAEPDMATKANLPYVREQELRCAAESYGIHPPIFMDYVDGQLPIVNQGQAVGKLVRLLREIRPQVVVTFGPEGIYGHYDHIAVHRWTTIAANLAMDKDCFPGPANDACAPHRVDKLYFRVIATDQVERMGENGRAPSVSMDGVPFPMVGYPREDITTEIDVSAYVEKKVAGIRCHLTQIGRHDPEDEWFRGEWVEHEDFILAKSTVPKRAGIETDLFDGLR